MTPDDGLEPTPGRCWRTATRSAARFTSLPPPQYCYGGRVARREKRKPHAKAAKGAKEQRFSESQRTGLRLCSDAFHAPSTGRAV